VTSKYLGVCIIYASTAYFQALYKGFVNRQFYLFLHCGIGFYAYYRVIKCVIGNQ